MSKRHGKMLMAWATLLLALLWAIAEVPIWAQDGVLWKFSAGDRVQALAISADGQRIAVGSRDNTLRLFDYSGHELWRFTAENSVLGVDIAAGGEWVAVASEDRFLYLLDAAGNLLWQHKATRAMNHAAIADDGSLVAGTSDDRSFYVLDGQGNLLWHQELGIDVEAVAIYGKGDNARVVVGSDHGVIAIYGRDGALLLETPLDYDVLAVAVTPNGARIAAGTSDGQVHLLNGSNGRSLWSYQTPDQVNAVGIANDGKTVVAGGQDGVVYLFDAEGTRQQTFAQSSEVLDVALSADGNVVALGTAGSAGAVIDRMAAIEGLAASQTRRRWMIGSGLAVLFGLVAGGVVAARYTATGHQLWSSSSARPRELLRQIWKARLSYLLLLPTLILLLTFNYYPAFSGLYHAFTDWSPGAHTKWIGLENFEFLLGDRFFWSSFRNTIILVVVTIVKTLTIPLLAAELIFHVRNHTTRYWLRTLFVVPLVLPVVVEILLWNNIYDPTIGLLNQTLIALGLESWTRVWYGDATVALASIIFIGFPWADAFALLIFYGGLISISDEIFDASKVDGAAGWTRFRHIDLPLLVGQMKLLVILNFINAIQTFELVYLTTGGGPGAATYTPALELYYMAMRMDKLGVSRHRYDSLRDHIDRNSGQSAFCTLINGLRSMKTCLMHSLLSEAR